MIETLISLNKQVNNFVWGPPMIIALMGVGVYITFRTGFIQFTSFGRMWRETFGKIFHKGPRGEGDISPFQAVTVAMGGTVGVGNIAGVATAIALGGPGAIFWMMVSGVIGMATKFAEVVLGLHYRKRDRGGPMIGGPMTYIAEGLGKQWRWLALAFCIFGSLAAFGIGNMVQANSVADGMTHFGIPRWVTGMILVVTVGLVTIGGIQRIAQVAVFCVPFMVALYLMGSLTIIFIHAGDIPEVLALILTSAFNPTAAAGGFAGASVMYALRYGIARGVFSNEAGMGSAPMAHATARVKHPVQQGFWGIFEVFLDTIVICFMTALVILLTGVWTNGMSGASLTISGFQTVFGTAMGASLVTFCMILTAYDTLLAWCFYGETCASYIFGHGNMTRMTYRVIWLPFTILGAMGQLEAIWNIADTLNGLMAIPNIIALFALGGVVAKLTKDFLASEGT